MTASCFDPKVTKVLSILHRRSTSLWVLERRKQQIVRLPVDSRPPLSLLLCFSGYSGCLGWERGRASKRERKRERGKESVWEGEEKSFPFQRKSPRLFRVSSLSLKHSRALSQTQAHPLTQCATNGCTKAYQWAQTHALNVNVAVCN